MKSTVEQSSQRTNSIKRARYLQEKRRRKKMRQRMFYLLSFVLFLTIILITGESQKVEASTTICIETQDIEMYQDGERPVFRTVVTVDGDRECILDESTGYDIEDLIEDIENGEALNIECEALDNIGVEDELQDGTYIIDVHLSDEVREKINKEWHDVVRIQITDGNLDVRNKMGYWDDNMFLSWDGTLLQNQWVKVEGVEYYIDEDGAKLISTEKQIGLTSYTFDDNGMVISSELYIDPEQPMLALTFDDGPSEYTDALLEVLELYDVHATFFVQGIRIVEDSQDTLCHMLEIGCEIGNHSTYHANLSQLSREEIQVEMDTTSEKIQALTGEYPTVMRPPYGAIDALVQETVEFPIIQWNVDTMDWTTEDASVVVEHILSEASDGDIILMHDTKPWSVEAAIEVIPILIEEGYQLVTVSEMAEAKGIELIDGEPYYFMDTL